MARREKRRRISDKKILGRCLYPLINNGARYVVVSMCLGGGMGAAALFEVV